MSRSPALVLDIALLLVVVSACRNSDLAIRTTSGPAVSGNVADPGTKATIKFAGAIIRGDTMDKNISLVFTGDEFGDGGEFVLKALNNLSIKASFFLTGNFYRNEHFMNVISKLRENGNYLGSHSDKHLLYCDWTNRDTLLVSRKEFTDDLENSYFELNKFKVFTGRSPLLFAAIRVV